MASPDDRVGPATTEDLPAVFELLHACGLPVDGLEAQARTLWVARDARDRVVGCVALEWSPTERAALLRSLAVVPNLRGDGLGRALARTVMARARDLGATQLFLLTETAEAWFAALGFVPVDRARVPAAVRHSVEFTTACPASAVCMQMAV